MDGKNALYFCGGTVLGVLGTVAFLWAWENRQEQEHIPEQEPVIHENAPVKLDKSSIDDIPFEAPKAVNYNSVVDKLYKATDETPSDNEGDPKRITDEKYQELVFAGNYDTKLLTLYSDGVLADSTTDDVMSESDTFAALGPNYTARKLQRIFALGADDELETVFVRNDRLYTLYEITRDDRTYKEVTGR